MDPKYIVPFIASVRNVFSTMLQLPVEIGEPSVSENTLATYDVSGVIGMSGEVVGNVVLSFPIGAAKRVVALFAGAEHDEDSPDFSDAVGELVNMIAGAAKADFAGKRVSITTPNVVVGSQHRINTPSGTPVVRIPCTTDCGEVSIEIAIKEAAAVPAAA